MSEFVRPRPARLVGLILMGCLLSGCPGGGLPTGTGNGGNRKPVVKAPASPAPSTLPSSVTSPPTGTLTPPGSGIISNNTASLSGVVRVPSGLISNNGGSVIGNNAGNWRLLATTPESPLAKAQVRLLDASGKALLDDKQQPLVALTDDQGRYGFTSALPAQQILVEVTLPESKGQLKAIAPYASGVKKADLGLISTLTTTYILDQYVKNRPDPVARLERLTASVESETRLKAQLAFEGGNTAVPEALTTERLVATVEKLRQQNTTFNAQMEDVKQLLLVAGQSDLGSGRPGNEVDITNIANLAVAPGGVLYINAPFDRRVWRLRADGVLETAIGKGGTTVSPTVAGLKGPEAALGGLRHMAVDAQGRVLVVDDAFTPERGNAFRLQADGTVQVLWKGPLAARFVFPAGGDDVFVFTTSDPMAEGDMTGALWRVTPGQAPKEIRAYTGDDPIYLNNAETAGLDAAGHMWFTTTWATDAEMKVLRIKVSTTTGAMAVQQEPAEGTMGYRIDGHGHSFRPNDLGDSVLLTLADGTSKTIALPAEARHFDAYSYTADKTLYVAGGGKVYRLTESGALTRVVGAGQPTGTGEAATSVALSATGLAIDAQGVVYASDSKNKRVVKIQNGQLTTVSGGTATSPSPWTLQFDAQGKLHALLNDGNGVAQLVQIAADGTVTPLTQWGSDDMSEWPPTVNDFAIGKDGAVYVSLSKEVTLDPPVEDEFGNLMDTERHQWIKRLPLNGFSELEIEFRKGLFFDPGLDIGPDGALYVTDTDGDKVRARKWTAAGGFTSIFETVSGDTMTGISGLAFDGTGRMYLASGFANRILRYEAGTKTFTIIAGPGGKLLTGAGVDNSIEGPHSPAFDKDGNLYFVDEAHLQIKRLPASAL